MLSDPDRRETYDQMGLDAVKDDGAGRCDEAIIFIKIMFVFCCQLIHLVLGLVIVYFLHSLVGVYLVEAVVVVEEEGVKEKAFLYH